MVRETIFLIPLGLHSDMAPMVATHATTIATICSFPRRWVARRGWGTTSQPVQLK